MSEVRAQITGVVFKIEKQVGDSVEEGEAILILESMKMEIPVESPVSGVIASVAVAIGDSVVEDQVVAMLG
ncbi:MAG: acetyl-CoA carboxylase biotin carboxyl carrier protein subunit [Deltaproteobacteria bacterium]|jgi:acetyl-CoA carboxylase biotin carboxyl carrier protein|nr:acetyl-CoA carboxylase biotin carboxyl carrier protein subunit [Deltaproteobacteria bacterium]